MADTQIQPSQTQPSQTVAMAFDDGTQAYVPQERVADAVRDGGKLVQAMSFDDGSKAWVPFDKVHDAIHDGGQLVPLAVPKPTVNMQTSALGHLSAPAQVGSDVLKGVGEGALQTVHGVGELIRQGGNLVHSGLGNVIVPPSGQQALQQVATPENLAQGIGVGAESIAEAVLGDEALKGLSLGDKLLHAGKVGEYYEKASPFVKRLMERGLTYARGATVAGGETTAKTGDVGEGAKAAAETAVAAPALDVAFSGTRALWNTATGKTIQNELQTGIRGILGNAASTAEVTPAKSPAVRNSANTLADAVEGKSKGLYQQIDAATNGEFTNVQNKIRNVEQKLREIAGTDDAAEEKLFNQKVALNAKLDEAIQAAQKAGVAPEIADQARTTWRQSSALRDLDTQIKASTFGNVKNAPEVVDPKKLVTRLQKLEDSGRLVDALGKQHADALMQQAYDSAKSAQTLSTVKKAAKVAVPTVGALGLGYEGLKHFIPE